MLQPDGCVRFLKPLWIDLGGIAKGFAVDLAVAELRSHGIADLVVQVGGETAVAGPPHRLGIPHPDDPDGSWCAVLRDPGQGLSGSTSGDYRLAKYSEIQLNQKLPDGAFKLKTTGKTRFISPQG